MKKGFSLLELLVTAGILTIMLAIAIPNYRSYIQSSRAKVVESEIKEIEKHFIACYREREHGSYKDENGNWIEPDNCFEKSIQGELEFEGTTDKLKENPDIEIKYNTAGGTPLDKKGCWQVKHLDSPGGKEGRQCIDFLLSKKGHKENHFKDGKNGKTGKCVSGVCQ